MKLINEGFYLNSRKVTAAGSLETLDQKIQRWLHRIGDELRLYFERAKQRRALAELDDHLLDDINVSRSAAQQEARKHFWQS